MRDCKVWLGLPHDYGDCPCSVSSQVLQDIIKKEMRNAPNIVVLNRRYSFMNTSLRTLFEHEELKGAPYSRLKILLRGEYETRYEVLRDGEN
jgi:hypothetical protein